MGRLHARVIAQSPGAELHRVVDPDPDAAHVAERFGAAYAPELDLAGSDAVVLAAPTETHRQLALLAITTGLPLLIEKPLADRLADSIEIVEASAAAGVPVMCGFLERYNPAVLTAMEIVRDPVHISAVRHSPYAPRIRTGVASDLLVHDVDLALRMIGSEPQHVRGALAVCHPSSLPSAEDVAEAVITFADGAVAAASASRIGQRKIRSFSIGEVHQLVEVDLLRRDVTIYRHVANEVHQGGSTYRQQTIIEIPSLVSAQEPLAAQLEHFLALTAGGKDADAERATILPAHRVIESIRSLDGRRTTGADGYTLTAGRSSPGRH